MTRRTLASLISEVVGTLSGGADSPPRRRWLAAYDLVTAGLLVLAVLMLPAPALAQTGQVVEYYHLDALGSVRVVTDQAGQVIARHDFLPFGEEWPAPQPTTKEKKLFTGHERDAETGLDYFGARYYRPQVARFTTIDPVYTWGENLADPQRWNRYAYARNNPLKFTDPDGRMPLPLITGAIGSAVYIAWNAYQNVQHGDAWNKNWGIEGAKGFVVGSTLGLAAPALAPLTTGIGAAAAGAAGSGVWQLPPVARGNAIEATLGGNLPSNFPTIDRFANGVATSIKSLDLNAATYQNAGRLTSRIAGYIDDVAAFPGAKLGDVIVPGGVIQRALDLAIPGHGNAAQQQVLRQMVSYAESVGVHMRMVVMR